MERLVGLPFWETFDENSRRIDSGRLSTVGTIGDYSKFISLPHADIDNDSGIIFIDTRDGDDSSESLHEMEEGLNGMVSCRNHTPWSLAVAEHGSRGDIQSNRRVGWCVRQGSRPDGSMTWMHERRVVRQRALSASTPMTRISDARAEYESECSTTAGDLTTTVSLSCIDSGSEVGTLYGEPMAVGKRILVSL